MAHLQERQNQENNVWRLQYESGFDFSSKHNISVSQLVKGHNSAHKSCAHFCGDTDHFSQLDPWGRHLADNKEYLLQNNKEAARKQAEDDSSSS